MRQISNLQILRAAAALLVVIGHAQYDALVLSLKLDAGFERIHLLPWGAGVDLFFVISGFIIVHASERLYGRDGAANYFLVRRVARVVPLYWAATILYVALLIPTNLANGRPLPTPADVFASFGFWPTDIFGDGVPRPLLSLGWTLNYEMFFYLIFAGLLGLTRTRAVLGTGLLLVALVGLGQMLSLHSTAPFFWTRPIILEFVLGMGIALLFRAGSSLRPTLRIALALLALEIFLIDPLHSSQRAVDWTTPNDFARLLSWGLPAALLVAAAALGPQGRLHPLIRAGAALGDASYSLYLVHPFVIIGCRKLWLLCGLHVELGLWPMVATSVVLSCAGALVVHAKFEKPLTEWAQQRLQRRPSRQVASA